jgi:hypothetical protein
VVTSVVDSEVGSSPVSSISSAFLKAAPREAEKTGKVAKGGVVVVWFKPGEARQLKRKGGGQSWWGRHSEGLATRHKQPAGSGHASRRSDEGTPVAASERGTMPGSRSLQRDFNAASLCWSGARQTCDPACAAQPCVPAFDPLTLLRDTKAHSPASSWQLYLQHGQSESAEGPTQSCNTQKQAPANATQEDQRRTTPPS